MNRLFILLGIVFLYGHANAQLGGRHSFEFLNAPSNARLAALGGVNVSLADRDVNFMHASPALVSDSLAGWGSAGYQFYVADIGQSTFTYLHDFKTIGVIGMGIQHIGYGAIDGYDESGFALGSFNSGETAIVLSKSHTVSHFRMGLSMKGIFSSIAGFRSTALAFDIAGVFIHPDHDLTVGLAIKNAGFVLSQYTGTSKATTPFDVQAGITFKPENMPLRFSATAFNMTNLNRGYYDVTRGDVEPGTVNKIFQHLNFGAEVLLSKNVNVLVGYNFLRHQELKIEGAGGAGFSFGLSARIKSFELALARNNYLTGTAGYTITLASNIKQMITRR